ncbi:hypothetical protein MY10362_005321 [Beauveria mimosiformis]
MVFFPGEGSLISQMHLDEIGTRVGTVPTVKSLNPLMDPSVAAALIARGECVGHVNDMSFVNVN